MKRFLTIFFLLFAFVSLQARSEEADTLMVTQPDTLRKKQFNNYSMIGFSYGATFRNAYFNPTKVGNRFAFTPNHFSVTFTNYHKMFGYLPYFGVQVGLSYGKEGYSFEYNEKGQPRGHYDGITDCIYEVVEIPALAQFHVDFSRFKVMADLGIYGGYRLSVDRTGPYMDKEYQNKFFDYENRFDFGLQGGLGLGIMLDPVELHLNATLRWGWQNFTTPDSNPLSEYSTYYYRFAYPLDLIVSFGIYYQLSKRTGRTSRSLRNEAYDRVYGKTEDN